MLVSSMRDMYARSLPDFSAMKRTLKRHNVSGAKPEEMLRSIARAGMADAFYLARLEHADELTENLQVLKGDDVAVKGGDGSIYALMVRRHAASMKLVETPIQNFLTNLTYVNLLGSSPAYALINGMQPFMVTLPWLTARHGFGAAGAAIARGTALA